MRKLLRQAYVQVQRPKRLITACLTGICLCLLFPTNPKKHHWPITDGELSVVVGTDSTLRFVNTAAQVALPVLSADRIGLVQLAFVALSTTAATHGLKRLADEWVVGGARLGERPRGPNSRHNMPSGHSSMASSAAYFVCRRYGIRHALYLIPILLLTMYARVALDAHTVAAVVAGALVGILMAAIFTSVLRLTTKRSAQWDAVTLASPIR